jgi:hypothetical protein
MRPIAPMPACLALWRITRLAVWRITRPAVWRITWLAVEWLIGLVGRRLARRLIGLVGRRLARLIVGFVGRDVGWPAFCGRDIGQGAEQQAEEDLGAEQINARARARRLHCLGKGADPRHRRRRAD